MIAGSRTINDIDLSQYVSKDVELIICGGAAGVDTVAEKYADGCSISKLVLRPHYKKYGKAAPLIRNNKMIEIADKVIVFWDGKSKGSKHTIEMSKKLKKELTVIEFK